MEIPPVIQEFLGKTNEWMQLHPVVSSGFFTIFGVILGAFLDIKKHALNIVSKTTSYIKQNIDTSKKIWIFNLFNNISFFSNTTKPINESRDNFRQEILSKLPRSPLTPIQNTICTQIASITAVHSLDKFNPKDLYEDAVREKNSNGVESAVIKYFQLFKKIMTVLKNIAVEKNAKTEIENLIAVVDRLEEMLKKTTDPKELGRQFDSCEGATLILLAIIYVPN